MLLRIIFDCEGLVKTTLSKSLISLHHQTNWCSYFLQCPVRSDRKSDPRNILTLTMLAHHNGCFYQVEPRVVERWCCCKRHRALSGMKCFLECAAEERRHSFDSCPPVFFAVTADVLSARRNRVKHLPHCHLGMLPVLLGRLQSSSRRQPVHIPVITDIGNHPNASFTMCHCTKGLAFATLSIII
ncbi:hypothetical protein TNCV_3839071 [Trichonephila clavipes]|nr:hypothetical protein TNCV_3839071 [Trichonephila clavipes]